MWMNIGFFVLGLILGGAATLWLVGEWFDRLLG